MTFKWDENVTLKFLEEYKKHECLWNPNSAEYYYCCSKIQAIRTIIDKLNIPFLTPAECHYQIEAITKKYEQEQSKTINGLRAGISYESDLLWYPLMQEMLTKTLGNETNESPKVTICTNSIPDEKKKTQINKKKKTKSNILLPAIEVTTHPCGYKTIKKVVKEKNIPTKKGTKKNMSDTYTNYVPCPGSGNNNSFKKLDEKEAEDNRTNTGLNNNPIESICISEIKKRRDIPRVNLQTKSTECSSCCRQSYVSKENNSDLNYNEFRNQYINDQHQIRTRFVPCPNSLKPPNQLFSNQRNSYNYSKNKETYTPERINGGNHFYKTTELYPRQFQDSAERDANLIKKSGHDDQGIVQFTPKVATKFENGTFEAVSQFKISIQCCEKGLDNRNNHPKTNRETQTFLERKQQSVCTNLVNFDTKQTQHRVETKQIGTDFEDFNQNIQNTKQIGTDCVDYNQTVCISRCQAEEIKKDLNDYILWMPGGKSLRLAKKSSSNEKFVECPGTSDNCYADDEGFSICTDASIMTQESRFVDSDTMTTPQLIQCLEEMLNMRTCSQEIQAEELESVSSSRAENRGVEEKESQCEACKNFDNEDEDLRFCFKKLFNKELPTSNCFPCLKEKIEKESSGDLTKTFLAVLKYALAMDCNAGNNLKGYRFRSKNKPEMIKRIFKCIKKVLEIESAKRTKKDFSSKNTQIEENKKYSKEVANEKEPLISRSVNAIPKNVGVTKQVETEHEALVSRSMNTFVEETPVEISKTILENVETNTDFPKQQKNVGTSPIGNIRSENASTQVKAHLSTKVKNQGKSIGTQKRDPILVRVVSTMDRQKMNPLEWNSSQSSQSASEECKKRRKRVCFNEKKEVEFMKKDFKCGTECESLNNDWSKIPIVERSASRIKKKVLEKKIKEVSKSKSLAIRKIFFSDFCI